MFCYDCGPTSHSTWYTDEAMEQQHLRYTLTHTKEYRYTFSILTEATALVN